jgi:hypothetical protein
MVVARYGLESYVSDAMLYSFSLPAKADKVPARADWVHVLFRVACNMGEALSRSASITPMALAGANTG